VKVKLEEIDSKDAADNDLVIFCLYKVGPLWSVWRFGWTTGTSCVFYDEETEARDLFKSLINEEDWQKLVEAKRPNMEAQNDRKERV
jgi:hypothetical protein